MIKCPECGNELMFDEGEVADFQGPDIPACWYCDNCGADFPEFPPPGEDMGDGRLSPEDELEKAALNRGQP